MRLSASGARLALFCLLLPLQLPLALSAELGVCTAGVRRFACAYATLALRLVAHFSCESRSTALRPAHGRT